MLKLRDGIELSELCLFVGYVTFLSTATGKLHSTSECCERKALFATKGMPFKGENGLQILLKFF